MCRARVTAADLIDPPPPPPEEEAKAEEAEGDAAGGAGEGGGAERATPEAAAKGSTKALLLLQRLRAMPAGRKAVVFSQFLGMLDIVAATLSAAGISFVRLDGAMSAARRAAALAAFAAPEGPRVFLASLKAGGVGMCVASAFLSWCCACEHIKQTTSQ